LSNSEEIPRNFSPLNSSEFLWNTSPEIPEISFEKFLGISPEFHPKKILRISPDYFSGNS